MPLLLAALCVGAGVVLGAHVPAPGVWGSVLVGALAVALGLALLHRRQPLLGALWRTLALGTALVALGAALASLHATLPAHHVARLLDGPDARVEVVLEGRVVGPPQTNAALRTRFALEARRLVLPDTALAVVGRVQVALAQHRWRDTVRYPPLRAGDGVRLAGVLRPPPPRRNPADFDYGALLERRGVFATLTVRDSADVGVLRAARPSLLAATRRYLEAALDRYVPSNAARPVLRALLLGDRSLLDEDTRDAFAQTGLMHLLAVSGLHVLLVGMVLFGVLRPLLLRLRVPRRPAEWTRALVTLAVLVAYAVLTGGSASVVRAVVMAALFIGSVVLERPASSLNSLGAAALVLLVARPAALFEPGFQLSFAAVAGLILLPRLARRWMPDRAHAVRFWLAEGFLATVAATLATAPLLLFHFGRLPLAGLVLNFGAMAVTMAAFAAALLLALTAWWPAAATLFGSAADYAARWLVYAARAGDAHLSFLAVDGYVTDAWALAAMAAGLVTLGLWRYPAARWKGVVVTLALVGAGLWSGLARGTHRPALGVLFFDVGQGDAALVALPGGAHLLVDAGVRDAAWDAGARTILPHLRRYGIDTLDAVVVSHPHADHLGGLPALLQAVPVKAVYHNGETFASALFAETQFWLDTLGVPHRALRAGDTLGLDPAVGIHVLAPEETLAAPPSTNDASVVLRVAYGETAFLFTGDAEAPSEAAMVARYGPLLHSTVVKVGHHGSATSSTPAFVGSVRPGVALVSVAAFNVYGLPSDSVLARWQRAGARLHLTRDAGALWLRSDGHRVEEVRWR